MDSDPDFMEQLRSVFDIEMSIENKRLRKQLQKKKEWLKSETHMLGAVRQVLMNVLMSLSTFSSERLLCFLNNGAAPSRKSSSGSFESNTSVS